MEKILKELIRNEKEKRRKYILFMLLKFSHSIKLSKAKDNMTPAFIIDNNTFMLIYPEESLDGTEYIFTDYDEILIVLQKLFNDSETVYFIQEDNNQDQINYLEKEINLALLNDDREQFLELSTKLNHLKR